MASGIYCDCGVELSLDDPICKSCGKRKSFKVDPRITDAAWADWYKHLKQNLENDELEKKSATGPVSENKNIPTAKRPPSFSSRREVKEEYRKRNSPIVVNPLGARTEEATYEGKTTSYAARAAAILVLVIIAMAMGFESSKNSGSSSFSREPGTSLSLEVVGPSQSTIPESTQDEQLAPGDPWDIYIAYYVGCAISQYDDMGEFLNCSGNGNGISKYTGDGKMEKYIVPNWVDSKATREFVCSNPYQLQFAQEYTSDVPAVDKYFELQIEQSKGLLVTAALVSPPILEEATLSNVIDFKNPSSLFTESGSPPTERESETYSEGFCIAHFRVAEMPTFNSALIIYTPRRMIEWTLNPDEVASHNFLIATEFSDNYVLDLWNSSDFGSRVK